jgi:predicted deacylase
MHLKDFELSKLEKNHKTVLRVEISKGEKGEAVQQTLLVIRGNKDGPILLLTGGVHGDEFEGPQTIMKLFHEIDSIKLSGSLVGLVIANEPAYEDANRCNPIEGKNLAIEEGIFSEPAGATALAGLYEAVKREEVDADDHIVCLVTGSAFKDSVSLGKMASSGKHKRMEHDQFSTELNNLC